ncbi:hypothetical protein K431DRAFT_283914 [Polychaeton citri CBS 116435]|uniref:C2H2-type domain-containing protein n=1 Tax=Polychaeton citri CBS 116435 TaxID=1314669 RepID=A0A9P4QAP1_9PEZI|nr:hypothetical protein K431DRAFT_283914 [Polychaeton citri CBS 116435]
METPPRTTQSAEGTAPLIVQMCIEEYGKETIMQWCRASGEQSHPRKNDPYYDGPACRASTSSSSRASSVPTKTSGSDRRFVCWIDHKVFSRKYLKQHMLEYHKMGCTWVCLDCGVDFGRKSRLNKHCKKKHGCTPSEEYLAKSARANETPKISCCGFCERCFRPSDDYAEGFLDHVIAHYTEKRTIDQWSYHGCLYELARQTITPRGLGEVSREALDQLGIDDIKDCIKLLEHSNIYEALERYLSRLVPFNGHIEVPASFTKAISPSLNSASTTRYHHTHVVEPVCSVTAIDNTGFNSHLAAFDVRHRALTSSTYHNHAAHDAIFTEEYPLGATGRGDTVWITDTPAHNLHGYAVNINLGETEGLREDRDRSYGAYPTRLPREWENHISTNSVSLEEDGFAEAGMSPKIVATQQ